MMYFQLISFAFIILLSACDLDKDNPSTVNMDLNTKFHQGDYIINDAEAQLTAVQTYHHIYILFPPDSIPRLITDTLSSVFAKFKFGGSDRISVGTLLFNNDTIPYNQNYGYSSTFNSHQNKKLFEFGSKWNFEGNERYNIPGSITDISSFIPRLVLDSVPQLFKKSEGIQVTIKSTDINCNRLVMAIKYGDSIVVAKEFEPFSTQISFSPNDLSSLASNESYELIVKAKNYKIMINNNKKHYYLNEINSNHYFSLQ